MTYETEGEGLRSEDPRNVVFCEKVREAYLEIYGADGLETDEPFSLGTVMVATAANYLSGDLSSILIWDGSRLEALGLAREAIYYLLPQE